MSAVRAFFVFLYDFLVGDDVALFAVVVVSVVATALLADAVDAWWLLPVLVCAGLAWSVWRAARRVTRG
jgi:hypothetical protein